MIGHNLAVRGACGAPPLARGFLDFGRLRFFRPRGSERRQEARYNCADPCEIRVEPGARERVPGTVRDVSRSGLRLEITVPVLKGSFIEVMLPKEVVIFGEVRYCRPGSGTYQVGVQIQEVFYGTREIQHLHDDDLSLYLVGKGLTACEVIRAREHLQKCRRCRERLAEAAAILNPKLTH